jgi:hypothetical protein
MSTQQSPQIFDVNPYENHTELSQTESELLWEYAKLNQQLKIVRLSTTSTESNAILSYADDSRDQTVESATGGAPS